MSYIPSPATSAQNAAGSPGFAALSAGQLSAVLQLAGLPADGTKDELVTRLTDAAKSAPQPATVLGQLRSRVREMEARVAKLETGGPPSDIGCKVEAQAKAAMPKKEKQAKAAPAPEPAQSKGAPSASGITESDLEAYQACLPPKIKGKPTDEQKAANAELAAKKKEFLKKLAERLGGDNTVKKVTKELDKKVKQAMTAAKNPVQEAKVIQKVPMSCTQCIAGGSLPEPRFGEFQLVQSDCHTGRAWSNIQDITHAMNGQSVWIRARKYKGRSSGKKLCFLTLRQQFSTIQCVVEAGDGIPVEMSAFAGSLPTESLVDVFATVMAATETINSCTQSDVELKALAFYCVSKSESKLPLQVVDAARSEAEIAAAREKKGEDGKMMVEVKLDTRLNHRMLDLRTPANQAIMKINAAVGRYFRDFLTGQNFTEIHSPKIIAGASEGGASVFKLQYMDLGLACLAQSPQLYKQMGVCCDLERVFEIGPVFRAEKSFTNRHLTEYTGLDFEMSFKDHYSEALEVMDLMFTSIFDRLYTEHKAELDAIRVQYPFEDLMYQKPWTKITHANAVDMLNKWGTAQMPKLRADTPPWMHPYLEHHVAVASCGTDEDEPPEPDLPELTEEQTASMRPFKDPWVTAMQCAKMGYTDDFTTPQEKQLGRIMHDERKTDFYIVDKFPLSVRPFYTMPDPVDPKYSNSYDIFLRGEEIMSGAQRIHDPELLVERVKAWDVPVESVQDYIDAFKFGAYPHAGGGVGLERVVMLYLGLPNIRMCTMFPRDARRMTP